MINPYVINIIIIIYIETTVYKCFMMFNIKDTTNQQQKKEKKELREQQSPPPPAALLLFLFLSSAREME